MGEGHGWERPRTPLELHELLAREFGIEVPMSALIAGHASPFDYLVHAFFEEEGWVQSCGAWRERRSSEQAVRDCVVWANRGGGKTFLGAVVTMLDMIFKPGVEIRILGGSMDQSKRMHAHLAGLFRHGAIAGMVEGKITQTRVRLNNGSTCEVLAQSQTSVRGTRVQKLRCDEVELFDPDVWEAAQLTTRSKQCGDVFVRGAIECLSTMHVPHGIMFKIVKEASGGRRRLFKWGVVDVLGACDDTHRCVDEDGEALCPLYPDCGGRAKGRSALRADARPTHRLGEPIYGHISVEDAIDLRGRVGDATWQSEMLCLRPSRSDTVLPEFDVGVHVARELPRNRDRWLWLAGMDFGIRAPTVVLRAGVDCAGVLWIVDEHVLSDAVLDVHIGAIKDESRWPVPSWVGVDPAGRQRNDQTGLSNIQRMRREGLDVRSRAMGLGEGLMLVRARLKPASGEARLFVHERCEKLIESLERYHYPREDPQSLTPVKDGFDHAVDALRYLIVNLDRPVTTTRGSYL